MSTPEWLRTDLMTMQTLNRVYRIFSRLYDGDVEEHFASRRIRDELRDSEFYRINLSRTAVDAPMERTTISGIMCDDAKAKAILDDFWETNELEFESFEVHEKSYEFGNSAIICLPDEDGVLQAYVHSPESVAVFYDPAKPRVKSHAIHIYSKYGLSMEDEQYFDVATQDLYFYVVVYDAELITTYVSIAPVAGSTVDMNTVELRVIDEVPTPIAGVVPVFHFRTSRGPVGRSRLVDAAGPQLAINDTLTALMASIKAAGYRQRYLTTEQTVGGHDLLTGDGDGYTLDGVETNEFTAGPDTVWTFAGQNVNVGSFDVTESSNFLSAIDAFASYMAKVTDVPVHYFSNGATAPSGESYRQGERPLTAVVDHCKALYAASWTDLFDYVLAFYGTMAEATVTWAPGINDDLDYWQTQLLKLEAGFPIEAILAAAGVPQDIIDEWMANRPQQPIAPIQPPSLIPPGAQPTASF